MTGQEEVLESLVDRCEEDIGELSNLKVQVAVLQSEMVQVKKDLEESSRRRFSLMSLLIGAILGALLALLGQMLLAAYRK